MLNGRYSLMLSECQSIHIIFQVSVRPVVILLGGKRVRVGTPFINVFQKKKAWNLPKSSSNLSDFKTCFFPPQNVAISKLFFFSLLEMWRFSFVLEIFQNAHFTMYVFMGDFLADFRHKKNKISCFAPLCVCLSVVKQLRKFHRSRLFQDCVGLSLYVCMCVCVNQGTSQCLKVTGTHQFNIKSW